MKQILTLLMFTILFASCAPGGWRVGTSPNKKNNLVNWKADKQAEKAAKEKAKATNNDLAHK
jgi:hypothetical protein